MALDTLPGLQGIGPAPVKLSNGRAFIDARPNVGSDPLSSDDVLGLLRQRLNAIQKGPSQTSDAATLLQQRGLKMLDEAATTSPQDASLRYWMDLSDRIAARAPGKEEYVLAGDEAQAEAMRRAKERYPDLPVPHMEPSSFRMPELSLPTPPHPQQATLDDENPMSAVGAAVAGILAPAYAGHFLAATLRGGLEKVKEKNRLAEQEFSQSYERQVQLNAQEMRKAEAEERVDYENRKARYEEAEETRLDQMRKASEYAKELTVQGTAEREKTLLEGTKRGREAQLGAERLRALLDERFKAKELLQKEGTSLIEAAGRVSASVEAAKDRQAAAAEAQRDRLAIAQQAHEDRIREKPFSLAPGAQRYDANGNLVTNNPALPISVPEGGGLVNRTTGQPVGPRIPKTPSASQKTLSPAQRLTQLRSQQSQFHADTARLFEKRKKFMADWRKAHPDGTSAQMFADPTYKAEFEAPEREARKKLNEVETQISDVMSGGTGSKKDKDPLGLFK
jgi:hypothetical protein